MERAGEIVWGKYVISAPAPFERDWETLRGLNKNGSSVLREAVPRCGMCLSRMVGIFCGGLTESMILPRLYGELGWRPRYTFESALEGTGRGRE